MDEKNLSENYKALKATVEACDADYEKFTSKKVKVSANRVRANMLNCKKLCDVIRKQLLDELRECPTKPRGSKKGGEEKEPEASAPVPEPEPAPEPVAPEPVAVEVEPTAKKSQPRKKRATKPKKG